MNLLPKIIKPKRSSDADTYHALMRQEAKIGGTLFGPIPVGRRREFFCLDVYTWVWHEEWTDAKGVRQTATTRYKVRPSGIIKVQGNQPPQPLSVDESYNLYEAINAYDQKIGEFYANQPTYA